MSANEPGWLRPTPRYQRVLGRADEIARATGSPVAGPEHLLLAIIHDGDAVPSQALANLVSLDLVEAALLAAVNSPGYAPPDAAKPGLPSAFEARGAKVAASMGRSYLGVEHLFLAIVADRDCVATKALARAVDPGQAEAAVLDVMNSPGYRGVRGTPVTDRVYLPAGTELDGPLRAAIFDSLPAGASVGFNWESGRPWVHVTEPGDTREVLNAALARLGRPGPGVS